MTVSLDWRLMSGIASGVMGWQPSEFWRATPCEFWTAWSQWARAKGLSKDQNTIMTKKEMFDMMAKFPDALMS